MQEEFDNFFPFIDAHFHVTPRKYLPPGLNLNIEEEKNFVPLTAFEEPESLLEYMDKNHIKKLWIINYVSDVHKISFDINEWSTEYCSYDKKRLIPFGSINIASSKTPYKDMERLRDLGIRGIKIHGPHMWIDPAAHLNNGPGKEQLEATYSMSEKWGWPVMFHTGTSIVPLARSRFGNPLSIEDVAVSYPNLKIILSHAGRPLWGKEAAFVLRRFENVYLDVSSIPPKLFEKYVIDYKKYWDKMIFGSDFPGFGAKPPLENAIWYAKTPILPPEIKLKLLRENAEKLIF